MQPRGSINITNTIRSCRITSRESSGGRSSRIPHSGEGFPGLDFTQMAVDVFMGGENLEESQNNREESWAEGSSASLPTERARNSTGSEQSDALDEFHRKMSRKHRNESKKNGLITSHESLLSLFLSLSLSR